MKTPTLRARCLTGIILSLRLVSYYRIITRFPDISPEIGWKNGPFNYTFISEKCTPGKMYTRKIYQALKCTPENCTSGNMYTRKIVHLEQPWKLYTEKCTLGKMYTRKNVHSKSGCTNFRVYIFPDVQFSGVHFSGVQISVYKFPGVIPMKYLTYSIWIHERGHIWQKKILIPFFITIDAAHIHIAHPSSINEWIILFIRSSFHPILVAMC